MRAKFRVEAVTHYATWREVQLSAVHDGSPENNQFAQSTPAGTLKMTITNPDAMDFLEPGKSYYLDFSAAAE